MNEDLPSLDIAIATHLKDGIERVASMLMAETPGIRYVVSWQHNDGHAIPESLLSRSDVTLLRFDKDGLSLNKNNALTHCSSEIVYFTDDDVTLFPEGISQLRQTFLENPDIDLATFRSLHGDLSRFPSGPTMLNHHIPKNYGPIGIEMAFRRNLNPPLRYCPEFGFGENIPMIGTEDEMLFLSAIRRGFSCCFFPITICAHPHDSTGMLKNKTPRHLMASGCLIALTHPYTAIMRIPLKAWRLHKNHSSRFFKALYYITKGALKAPGVVKRNHDSLW